MDIFLNPEALQEFISGFGAWAPVIFFVLQVVKSIFVFIPGNVTTLIGGAMFGFAKSFFISAAATILGSCIAFGIARKLGVLAVRKIVGAKAFDNYERLLSSDMAASRVHVILAVTMMLPFFPDDLICFLAGLSKTRFRTFLLIIVLCRPWGLLFSALVGAGAISLPIGWIAVLIAVSIGLGVLSAYYAPKIEAAAQAVLAKITRLFGA